MISTLISTERLSINTWDESQVVEFYELTQDNGFNAHLITIYKQPNLESAQQWLRENIALHNRTGLGKWGIWEKSSNSLIGMAGLTPWEWEGEALVDVTYRFRESAWGKGHGPEVARALVKYGFEVLKLKQITATITPDNLGSIHIAKKLGMSFDKRIVLKGVDTELYRYKLWEFVE